jgi:hypothetical protein
VVPDVLEVGQSARATIEAAGREIPATSPDVLWQGPVLSVAAWPTPITLAAPDAESLSTPATASAVSPPSTAPTATVPPAAAPAAAPTDAPATTSTGEQTVTPAGASGSTGAVDQSSPLIVGASAPAATGAIAFVDQRGTLTGLHEGVGRVTALYEGRLVSATVTIRPKPADFEFDTIRANLTRDGLPADNRSILVIHVVHPDGSPVAGAAIKLELTDGHTESSGLTTDADGAATAHIIWKTFKGGLVTASSPGLAPVTLGQQ